MMGASSLKSTRLIGSCGIAYSTDVTFEICNYLWGLTACPVACCDVAVKVMGGMESVMGVI